jgi:hypothetical protein
MNKSEYITDHLWREAVFLSCLAIVAIIFLIASLQTVVEDDGLLDGRSIPALTSGIIALYAIQRIVSVFSSFKFSKPPRVDLSGIVLRIIIPLSLTMVAYVGVVILVGYPIGTGISMMVVLWIFDVRRIVLNIALSVTAALVSNYLFVELLGMFMPKGWLVEMFMTFFSS